MTWDVATWVTLAVLALIAEGTGLAGWHHWRPLTDIVVTSERKNTFVAGGVAAFVLWLAYHFLIQNAVR